MHIFWYEQPINSNICQNPKCKEPNNPSFSFCWRYGAPINETLELSQYEKYEPKKDTFPYPIGFIMCWGLYFLAMAVWEKSNVIEFKGAVLSRSDAMSYGILCVGFSVIYLAILKFKGKKNQKERQ